MNRRLDDSRLASISADHPVKIELGCGNNKRHLDAIGIDALAFPGVDLVGDIFDVLAEFPDGSVASAYAYHFIEHVVDVPRLLSELMRVVKTDGLIELVAPHFSNPYFYSDPTHKSFFGLYTFCYYTQRTPFRRTVPSYGQEFPFTLESVDLVFKSPSVFPVRYAIKRALGAVFNATVYLREFYEENLSTLIPCYEVRYRLRRQ